MKAVIIFALLALTAFSQSCDNPMASNVNMSYVLLDTPSTDVSGLQYCTNLQSGGSTCCNSTTIDSIKARVDNFTSFVTYFMVQRDSRVGNAYQTVMSNVTAMFNDIMEIANTVVSQLNLTSDQMSQYNDAKSLLNQILDDFKGNITDAVQGFKTYQQNRAQCFKTLLDIQASAYCLACDPNWSSNGVNEDGSINYSQNLCNRIQTSCYGFLTSQANYNKLFLLVGMAQELPEAQAQLAMYKSMISNNPNFNLNNLPGVDISQAQIDAAFSQWSTYKSQIQANMNFTQIFQQAKAGNYYSNTTMQFSTMPQGCTSSSNCNWLCTHFLQGGAIQLNPVIAGGNVDDSDDSDYDSMSSSFDRILIERFLDSSDSWDPTEGESGVTITVEEDPADQDSTIQNSSSRIFAALMTIAVSVFALLA